MMPEPNPTLVSIITTDGPTSWTNLTYSDWSLNDCELAAGELVPPVVVLQAASNAAIAVTANPVPHPRSAFIRDILVLPWPVLIVSEPPLFFSASMVSAIGHDHAVHEWQGEPVLCGVGTSPRWGTPVGPRKVNVRVP